MHLETIERSHDSPELWRVLQYRRAQPNVSPALAEGRQKQWSAHTSPLSDMVDEYRTKIWSRRLRLRTGKAVVGGKGEKGGAPVDILHITRDVYTWATA